MEGGVRRGRWNKNTPLCKILLLMYMLQPSEELECPYGDYPTENGICCNKCSPGFKLLEDCHAPGQRTKCTPCPEGQYTDRINYSPNCRSCKRCKEHDREVSKCNGHQNTICRCEDGFYKFNIDSVSYECRECKRCGSDEKETQACTPEKNTVCECKENFYRVNSKCEPCKNCTAKCEKHCLFPPTLNTKGPGPGKDYVFSIIVAAVAVVLSVLLIVTTYALTKWCTNKQLLKSSSQSSDDSPDSCEQVLIQVVEPSNNSIQAAPVSASEQPSNLPDCVPLEIKISELIYMVLELVPVLQVKQLVRSLGVKDTEIEQLELDYRSCREAHYQMMRVWAERGSRAGGMLHLPLLKELLDELRKMHLGQAAEELKTKYGFQ